MFYGFSKVMAAGKKLLPAAMVLVLLASAFSGCKKDAEDVFTSATGVPDGLLGKWLDPLWLDGYEITRSGNTDFMAQIGNDWMDPKPENSVTIFANATIRHVYYNSNSGIIIFEYIAGDEPKPGMVFSAVYYSEFTGNSVKAGTAAQAVTYDNVDVDTLEKAKAKFTIDKSGEYYDWPGGPYVKQ